MLSTKAPNKFIIPFHFAFASSPLSKKPVKLGLYSVIRWHILRVLLPLYGKIKQQWNYKLN